jgi:nucleotide-binding universal stress UspA family protein
MVQPVIVGIDGSPASEEALRLAVEQARFRRTGVRAVHVWHVPEGSYLAGFAPSAAEVSAYEEEARRVLDSSLARISRDPAVRIEPVLVEGDSPAATLVAESGDAALLVVGSRGLHGLREVVLGSVSHACCQHALCPVLVMPAGAYDAEQTRLAHASATDQ